jgi:tRNA1Val (adenine37-N6)-methyltransferase
LELWQPLKGYRFSVDPLLLIDFVTPPLGRLVDCGAGVGVIALGLLLRDPAATATLVELQPRLAALARRNADDNAVGARVTVRQEDLAHQPLPEAGATFDLAVSNPPYRTLDEGPASPIEEAAIAQHEVALTLPTLVATIRRLLKPGGRAALVYPAARLGELLGSLDGAGLKPRRLRCVHPRADEPANRVLVEAHKGARGPLVIEPPLILRDASGYTAEAARLLGES